MIVVVRKFPCFLDGEGTLLLKDKNTGSKKIMQDFDDSNEIENYLENHECSDVNGKMNL